MGHYASYGKGNLLDSYPDGLVLHKELDDERFPIIG
jgi:hypothetical protein